MVCLIGGKITFLVWFVKIIRIVFTIVNADGQTKKNKNINRRDKKSGFH